MKLKSSPKKSVKHHSSKPQRPVKRREQPKAPPSNWSDLARLLGVSRQALGVHKNRLGPDAPGLTDVDGWAMVLAAHDSREGTAPKAIREKIARARLRLLRAAAGREQLKLRKERGETLDKFEVGRAIGKTLSTFWNQIARLFETELPGELSGMAAPKIQAYLSTVSKRLQSGLRDGLEAALIPQGQPNTPTK